jgi:hypothetical protein
VIASRPTCSAIADAGRTLPPAPSAADERLVHRMTQLVLSLPRSPDRAATVAEVRALAASPGAHRVER